MYQLEYFPIRGLGEVIRFLLEDNNIPYENKFVQKDEWSQAKKHGVESGQIPFGQLPVLKDGNLNLAQGGAIIRYLARKHALYGENMEEQAIADMLYEAARDLRYEYFRYIFQDNWEDQKEAFLLKAKVSLACFEKHFQRKRTKYVASENICFADYNLFDVLDHLHRLEKSLFVEFPHLNQFYETMKNRPRLAAYLASDRHFAQPVFIPLGWTARG
ncbi:hypothetical protein GpartN1_g5775.t1 [Galdieria partita]|uniref:glutathione transferase n=1 Tax=Galdieria partita TaxID=83374 RepID=A0A9C7PYJ7_9RHOD|nr:hypothetical protein GpartN1_g5064.t1 [Galdieria partita]GJQ13984.1 hypothetical protein GpartN1_g5775.t1 [Galdieria partita]